MKQVITYLRKPVNCILLTLALLQLTTIANLMANTNTEESGTGFATVESYISRYKHIAIEEMQNVGIPASVKLAQAILESQYGNSNLAIEANNHFGIKCGSRWNGLTMNANDDKPNECFRKYRNSYESYIDHSQFLEQSRYASLFSIALTDYKSWAKGLQDAGYATNPNYAHMVIEIIERHKLYKIDQEHTANEVVLVTNNGASPIESSRQFKNEKVIQARTAINRPVETRKASGRIEATEPLYYNGIKTIILESPATPRQVEMLYGINSDKVCMYNNVQPNDVIPANTKIYLQPMRNKSSENMIIHTVASGETMKEISQYYGIKLSKLYKRNRMSSGSEAMAGQIVYLRGKAPHAPLQNDKYEVPPIQYKVKETKKVIIADKPVERKVNTTPSTTNRAYYAETEANDKNNNSTTETSAINYINQTDNESSYSSYKPVKEKVKSVVETVKNYVTTKDDDKPVVTTSYTRNNNGKVYGNDNNSNVVTSKPVKTTTYYGSSSNTDYSTSANNSKSYTYGGSTNSNYTTENEVITKPATRVVIKTPVIYTSETVTTTPASATVTHKVVKGDTLYNISKRNNTTVEKIKSLNNLRGNTIKLGQILTVVTNTVY